MMPLNWWENVANTEEKKGTNQPALAMCLRVEKLQGVQEFKLNYINFINKQ